MCQIFAGNAAKIRDILLNKPGVLDSLFKRNHDGLGAMYATSKKVLKMPKIVPKTIEEARAFIIQLPADDRNLVIHFRMKTSGHIDHDNAHPFVVLDGTMGMTHNGILSISTKSDETKCDTRHYIERYLRPMLSVSPAMARVPEWLEIVGNDIGSNRFVLMDNEGFISYVNHATGYEFDGIWFANTYSFDAGLIDEQFKPKTYTTGGNWQSRYKDMYEDNDWTYGNVTPLKQKNEKEKLPPNLAKKRADVVAAFDAAAVDAAVAAAAIPEAPVLNPTAQAYINGVAADIWAAVSAADTAAVADYLKEMPITTLYTLFQECDYVPSRAASPENFSLIDSAFVGALAAHDMNKVLAIVNGERHRYTVLAEAICWYGDWVGKAINAKGDPDLEAAVVEAAAVEEAAEVDELEASDRREAIEELTASLAELADEEADCRAKMLLATHQMDRDNLALQIDEIELERGIVTQELQNLEDEESASEEVGLRGAMVALAKQLDAQREANVLETTKQVVNEQQVTA